MEQTDMTDWVPVMLPPGLAPEVLRRVAAYLEEAQSDDPRGWGDATSADKLAFFKEAQDLEWRLVAELACHDDKPVPPVDLAERLNVDPGQVAGAVGPLNKRAKKRGWVSPVRPFKFVQVGPGGGSVKGLVLDQELKVWVNDKVSDMTDGES
ncbi:MAG: hypothetical protein Q8K58_16775 [Acidimicrobiales bacterium]|nr:hypothetical protein [Acidimicrobiales bacterium]